jgi:hypothetical protein
MLSGINKSTDKAIMTSDLSTHEVNISLLESDMSDEKRSTWKAEQLEQKLTAVANLLEQNSELVRKVETKRTNLGAEAGALLSRLEASRNHCDKLAQAIHAEILLREIQTKPATKV